MRGCKKSNHSGRNERRGGTAMWKKKLRWKNTSERTGLMKRDEGGGRVAAVMNGEDKDDTKVGEPERAWGGHVCSWDDKWTQEDWGGWEEEKGGGWSGEDSLAYAGLVHWAFPALPFYLPLFSLLLFSRNIWVGGRESNRVCEEEGESYSKWSDDRVRGREWQRK